MSLPRPVIVVPGITASYLRDEYPLPPEHIWTVMTKSYERAALHPDNLRYELQEPARVVPSQLYEVAYRELIQELRHNLSSDVDQPVPVFPFAYDWRQPLAATEHQLAQFVNEVVERTNLMRHYRHAGYGDDPKVNLVGHSMGGLIIAGYLERFGAGSRVQKVVSVAAPFRGSLEAVLKITTGMAALGEGDSSSRERESARLTPALYHLLPSFEGALRGRNIPADFFERAAWQPSVEATLAHFIARHGLEGGAPEDVAPVLFSRLLNEAKTHRMRLEGFSLESANLGHDDWLCIVGVGSRTRLYLDASDAPGGVELRIGSDQMIDRWGGRRVPRAEWILTGDGTVPYFGAVPPFLPPEKLVCLSPGDFGYWEVQDRLLSRTAGFHGIMCNMDVIHRLIVRHFTEGPDTPEAKRDPHGSTWGWRAPGLPARSRWRPPLQPLREKR